jgi:hypothetical protein
MTTEAGYIEATADAIQLNAVQGSAIVHANMDVTVTAELGAAALAAGSHATSQLVASKGIMVVSNTSINVTASESMRVESSSGFVTTGHESWQVLSPGDASVTATQMSVSAGNLSASSHGSTTLSGGMININTAVAHVGIHASEVVIGSDSVTEIFAANRVQIAAEQATIVGESRVDVTSTAGGIYSYSSMLSATSSGTARFASVDLSLSAGDGTCVNGQQDLSLASGASSVSMDGDAVRISSTGAASIAAAGDVAMVSNRVVVDGSGALVADAAFITAIASETIGFEAQTLKFSTEIGAMALTSASKLSAEATGEVELVSQAVAMTGSVVSLEAASDIRVNSIGGKVGLQGATTSVVAIAGDINATSRLINVSSASRFNVESSDGVQISSASISVESSDVAMYANNSILISVEQGPLQLSSLNGGVTATSTASATVAAAHSLGLTAAEEINSFSAGTTLIQASAGIQVLSTVGHRSQCIRSSKYLGINCGPRV